MTSTESLTDAQRDLLLELGFRKRHGFLYVFVAGNLRVEATIYSNDVWGIRAALMSPGSFEDDEIRIPASTSLRVFRQVISGLID